MATDTEGPTAFGIGEPFNWLVGGLLGGAVSAAIFGGLLWMVDSDIIVVGIPGLYGLGSDVVLGWTLHLIHGAILGLVFGALITREVILGTLTAEVETGFIDAMGPATRMTLAGIVFGLAVWAIFPLIGAAVVMEAGMLDDPEIPITGVEFLLGHLLFGAILGSVFSLFAKTAPRAARSTDPLEEGREP